MNYRSTINIMEPFEAYKLYQAVKLHFDSDSYDAVKYNYKTSAKAQAFFKRKDKYFFAKLAKKYPKQNQLVEYLVAQFTNGSKWVGDMVDEGGEKNYLNWQKHIQSLGYEFQKDLNTLSTWCNAEQRQFDDLLTVRDNQYPVVVTLYSRSEITLATVVILNKLTGFLDKANKEVRDPILWPDLYRKLKKTEPFIDVDLNKMRKAVVKEFS